MQIHRDLESRSVIHQAGGEEEWGVTALVTVEKCSMHIIGTQWLFVEFFKIMNKLCFSNALLRAI